MISSQTFPANPPLSPQFDRARLLSRILFILLSIGFFGLLAVLACIPVLAIWPEVGDLQRGVLELPVGNFSQVAGLSLARRAGAGAAAMLNMAPVLLILHHARNIFRGFAKGDVFTAASIAHIRAVGLWLMLSFAATFFSQILFNLAVGQKASVHNGSFNGIFMGLVVYVAAYVMAEARRIADDNAGIL